MIRFRLNIAVIMIFLAAVQQTAYSQQKAAQPQPTSAVLAARELLEVTGAVNVIVAGMRAALPNQKEQLPDLPEEFWTELDRRIVQDAPALSDSVALIYAEKISESDLRALTAFYKSDVGKRMVNLQPELIAASSAVGMRWGGRIGEEVANKLFSEDED